MFIPSVIRFWRMRKVFRATVNQLSQLDDRTLADIDIRRGEIHAVARRAAAQVVA